MKCQNLEWHKENWQNFQWQKQNFPEKQAKEKEKAKYNLPRLTEVRPCEWPCDDFLREAGIHEDFYALIETAGLTGFIND